MHHDPHTYLLPFRLAIWLGLFASGTGLVCIIYGVATHMSTGFSDPDWIMLLILILFLCGVQLIAFGILSVHIMRIYGEMQRSSLVRGLLGCRNDPQPKT